MNRRYVVLTHWGGELERTSAFGTWQTWDAAEKQADTWMNWARKECHAAGINTAPIAWVVELMPKRTSVFRTIFERLFR